MPRTGSKAPATDTDAPSPHDPALTGVLTAEYGMLMAALGAAWSASIARTSLFLVVLSAAGVALGFAGQSGPETFRAFAIAVLPLVLFRGAATFVRLVQVQRESVVYITGQNRIRHYFAESTPASRPYFVLPIHDDQAAIFRSVGTGMVRRPPRRQLLHLLAQTQGIVGVVSSAVAAAMAGLVLAPAGVVGAGLAALVAFVVTLALLVAYWQRSLADLWRSIRPIYPTPAEDLDAPF